MVANEKKFNEGAIIQALATAKRRPFQVRTSKGIHDGLGFALKDQGFVWQVGMLAAEMLDLLVVVAAQIVKAQAVLFRIHDGA